VASINAVLLEKEIPWSRERETLDAPKKQYPRQRSV